MASMLARAAGRFDVAFAALPPQTRNAVALAMHRAAPAIQQYQRDLEPLSRDPAIVEAFQSLALAVAFKLIKKGGFEGDWSKEVDEMKAAAPATADFLASVGSMLRGVLPGFLGNVVDVEPAAIADRQLAPPDAEIIDK